MTDEIADTWLEYVELGMLKLFVYYSCFILWDVTNVNAKVPIVQVHWKV